MSLYKPLTCLILVPKNPPIIRHIYLYFTCWINPSNFKELARQMTCLMLAAHSLLSGWAADSSTSAGLEENVFWLNKYALTSPSENYFIEKENYYSDWLTTYQNIMIMLTDWLTDNISIHNESLMIILTDWLTTYQNILIMLTDWLTAY